LEDHRAHFLDITTTIGFLDIVVVGNVLEFNNALSWPIFAGKVDKEVQEEGHVARWRYRQLIKWFSTNYVLVFGNSVVSPWYVVHRSLVCFAASLCGYMARWKMAPDIKGCTQTKYRKTVLDHLRQNWPELIPKFKVLMKNPPPSLLGLDLSSRLFDETAFLMNRQLLNPGIWISIKSSLVIWIQTIQASQMIRRSQRRKMDKNLSCPVVN
jgi:hypothetical protein